MTTVTEPCATCGKRPERGRATHHLGCKARRKPQAADPDLRNTGPACAKDGCAEPRAASKGPRPAKYCETHKTTSRSKR